MQDDLSPVEEQLLQMWRDYYPFLYWGNRINKINPLNEHDELEAVFTLLLLSDTCVTNLVAMLLNPREPWYFVKERAMEPKIKEVLNQFRATEDERVDLRNYEPGEGDIIGYTLYEDWEESITSVEFLLKNILGCPATVNEAEKELTFLDDPRDYIELCNGVINFRLKYWDLLNDLKHGFRLLPFEWDSIEDLQTITAATVPGFDLDEKKEEYEATKGDYVYFWRLVGKEGEEPEQPETIPEGYKSEGFGLIVYRINIDVCLGLSRTIALLLNNLITTGTVQVVEELEPLLDESGEVETFERFIPMTMLAED